MSFSVLGEGAEFTALCLFAGPPPDDLEPGIRDLPDLSEATISIVDFALSPYHDATADTTHHIVVRGADRPGLVARLSEVLAQHKANVVHMSAETRHGVPNDEYVIHMQVSLSSTRAAGCLAALGNTAEEQGMSYTVTPADQTGSA